jgi:periplasmic divalent cation tolerance protein
VGYVQVQFAIDDPTGADSIVASLLARRLVACGKRLGPVSSRYWWKGTIETAEEWIVILETRTELATAVIEAVVAEHPYEVPQVVATAMTDGTPAYLQWIDDVTRVAVEGETLGSDADS